MASLLWPRRLQRAQSGMPAGETAGLGGGAQGKGLWMGPPTHFQIPLPLRGCIYGQKVTSKVGDGGLLPPPPLGLREGQETPLPP